MPAMAAEADVPWEALYDNLRGFVGRRVRNPADVEDLVQRVMLRLVKGLPSLRDSDRLHPFVYRTARNVIVDHYRAAASRRESPAAGSETAGREEPDSAALPEDDSAAFEELAACLSPMLDRLEPAYREAVVIADLQGATQVDAAARAGISVSGMKSRVQRGRRQLRAALEACCRVHLDRRGGVIDYHPRRDDGCACGSCAEEGEATPAADRQRLVRIRDATSTACPPGMRAARSVSGPRPPSSRRVPRSSVPKSLV